MRDFSRKENGSVAKLEISNIAVQLGRPCILLLRVYIQLLVIQVTTSQETLDLISVAWYK